MTDAYVASAWRKTRVAKKSSQEVGDWKVSKTDLRVFVYWRMELNPTYILRRKSLGTRWTDADGVVWDSVRAFLAALPPAPLSQTEARS